MAGVLVVVGALWAILGVANLVGMDWRNLSSGIQTYGLMFNVVLFILPGLVLIGIGESIRKKNSQTPAPTPKGSNIDRLKELDRLLAIGEITEVEHAKKRAAILEQI